MDRLNYRRQIIQDVLTDYHHLNEKSGSTTESALAFDEVHDQYLLLLMGWHKDERIKSVMIHIRLKHEKIWIEQNMTEMRVAQELVEQGVSKDDIILGFQPPEMREYTGYGVV
ncbi:MAG TPA: XisI protein [Cyanophyceae cyanobacterium]